MINVNLMKNKLLLTIILILYILVPILILFIPYLYEIKFYLLTFIGIIIYVLMRFNKVSNKELGITKKNFSESIKRNMLLVILCFALIIIFKVFHLDKYSPTETMFFYIFYIFISCPIQEFLYRGVFGYFDMNNKNPYLWIVLSSLCYSFVHIIYKDVLTCVLTFIIGIIWYLFYKKDYNLAGVTLSHIVLGILTIALGIVN